MWNNKTNKLEEIRTTIIEGGNLWGCSAEFLSFGEVNQLLKLDASIQNARQRAMLSIDKMIGHEDSFDIQPHVIAVVNGK